MPTIKPPAFTDADVAEHRKTCPVCSTLGVKRADHEVTVREFTPGGTYFELTIKHPEDALRDHDIGWILQHASSLFSSDRKP